MKTTALCILATLSLVGCSSGTRAPEETGSAAQSAKERADDCPNAADWRVWADQGRALISSETTTLEQMIDHTERHKELAAAAGCAELAGAIEVRLSALPPDRKRANDAMIAAYATCPCMKPANE